MLIQTQSHVASNAHTSKPKHLHQGAKAQSGLICQNAGAQKPNGTQLQITNGERGSATAVTLLAMLHSLGTMGSLQLILAAVTSEWLLSVGCQWMCLYTV